MKKIIKDELKKVKTHKLDTDKDSFIIPKLSKFPAGAMEIGKVYKIELHPFITNPWQSSTLAANWNNGVTPKYRVYVVEVIDRLNNMVKVNGVADLDKTSTFYGWLPEDQLDVLEINC